MSNKLTGDSESELDCHQQINESIKKLGQLTQIDVQSSWRQSSGVVSTSPQTASEGWTQVELNQREHITWAAGRQLLCLEQQFHLPTTIQGYPLAGKAVRLALRWWAEEAQIFVNHRLVQAGDLFDCFTRVLLSPCAVPGEVITVRLKLLSPGHDTGALVHSRLIFEPASPDEVDPGFVADELAVLRIYLERFQPEKLETLAAAIATINWSALADAPRPGLSKQSKRFEQSLETLRQNLQPLGNWLKQRQVLLLGHAHLDLAWLWPVSETWEAAERTFQSVLDLLQEFPLTFCHSTPALYAWIEDHRPNLFQAIQQQVAAGRWEVVAGLWVEPELNLVSGESLVRQVLYGQLYVQAKFGALSAIAWLPDSFGFCWQLPQILKQGGIEYFVTQKLRWNDTTQFPHEVFWWRSPDGSQIFSAMAPPIGEDIDPVKMATFAQAWEVQTGVKQTLWLPGVGDHGGGPTRDMLETAQRWQQSTLFPCLKSATAQHWLQTLESTAQAVPVWQDELYLEFHRGCYTTHADQKRWNRCCESLLYQAELFASLATLTAGKAYPKAELEAAWKKILFNQFHDILPGSSIPEVFEDANRDWSEVKQVGTQILQASLQAIAAQITLIPPETDAGGMAPSLPIVVFNSLNWQRSEVVSFPLPENLRLDQGWQVYDLDGSPVPSQTHPTQPGLLFLASAIPSVGYRLFWLRQSDELVQSGHYPEDFVLENASLRVVVDPSTGDLSSIFDKINQREVLSGPGSQLQFFQDSGQYWDAWNIDPDYAQHPLPPAELKTIQWLACGPLQSRLRVVRQFNQSQFCQDYVLEAGSALLKIENSVDWQERQVLVKVAFPLTVQASYATYEIPCGAIQRSTQPNSRLEPREAAKWEVPALHWADLSHLAEREYGVSLLNDCKYGYDAQPNQLRLTLLRSPNWPDPNADGGVHQFTYAVYPHRGSWQMAETPRRGYELNQPLQIWLAQPPQLKLGQLPPVGRLIDLQANSLILMAFKQAEANPNQWILRCYECHGETALLDLQSDRNLAIHQPVDLLERPIPVSVAAAQRIGPWKISSFLTMVALHN
jgi:alpha-mannosidase